MTTPSEQTFAKQWTPKLSAIGWCIVALGVILRIGRFCRFRSLWLDEIYLSNSILTRGYQYLLFKPLLDWQMAPPGFLFFVRLSVSIFGTSEYALRVPSLIAGVVAVPLAFLICRRCLNARAGLFATLLIALLWPLIYYSAEVKQYSFDVVWTLAIVLVMLRLMEKPDAERITIASAIGGLSVFCSHAAIFALAGTGTVAFLSAGTGIDALFRAKFNKEQRKLFLVGGIWVGCFAVQFLLFIRPLLAADAHPHLVQYWENTYAFMPVWPNYLFWWLIDHFLLICTESGSMFLNCPEVALAGLALGLTVAFYRRGPMWMLVAPLPFVLIASAAKQYPFDDRLSLFMVPIFLMLIAAGIEAIASRWAGTIMSLVLGAILLRAVANTTHTYFTWGREETKPAYDFIAKNWQPGDAIYLSHYGNKSFDFYKDRVDWPADPEKAGTVWVQPNYEEDPRGILQDVKRFAGNKRVWVFLVHIEGGQYDKAKTTVAGMDEIGVGDPDMEFFPQGVQVYLYDCTQMPEPVVPQP
jgi:hypothetical protein